MARIRHLNTGRAEAAQKIIIANLGTFNGYKTITYQKFVSMFGELFPKIVGADPSLTRSVPHFVNAYTSINSLLAERGFTIVARNYYSKFQIANKVTTEHKIMHNRAKIDRIAAYTDRLADNLKINTNHKLKVSKRKSGKAVFTAEHISRHARLDIGYITDVPY